jgi:putative phosphoesterase
VRIGVLSDTHIRDEHQALPERIWELFDGVDCILHAGDVSHRSVLDRLASLAPVYAVRGNVEAPELAASLPDSRVLEMGGVRIGLTHGHLGPGNTVPETARRYFAHQDGVAAIVFGHSHAPHSTRVGDVLLFNPGSPTQRRRQSRHSVGLLTVEDGNVRGEILYL